MALWGKIIGGVAGFAFGGPVGAVAGAALGHAADTGNLGDLGARLGRGMQGGPARLMGMVGNREQVFAVAVTVLAAKLAKCDGVVNRSEIDAFKRQFRIEPQAVPMVGRLFDEARRDPSGFEPYARELGHVFADNRAALEQVLASLHLIARADGGLDQREAWMLERIGVEFGLDATARARARNIAANTAPEEDAYDILGIAREAGWEAVRARWKQLMQENHPDRLASRGVPPDIAAKATERVARINAAYDRIKRERGL